MGRREEERGGGEGSRKEGKLRGKGEGKGRNGKERREWGETGRGGEQKKGEGKKWKGRKCGSNEEEKGGKEGEEWARVEIEGGGKGEKRWREGRRGRKTGTSQLHVKTCILQ